MSDLTRWDDIRDEILGRIPKDQWNAADDEISDELRGYALAQLRRERKITQAQIATNMGVTVGRVSQIESGRVSGVGVLRRYVEALGGTLTLTAVLDGKPHPLATSLTDMPLSDDPDIPLDQHEE